MNNTNHCIAGTARGATANQPANLERRGGVEIELRSVEDMQSHRCLVTSLLAYAAGSGVQESQSASSQTLGTEMHRFLSACALRLPEQTPASHQAQHKRRRNLITCWINVYIPAITTLTFA